MFTALGSPTQAFADAFKRALEADATLMTLVTGIFGHVSEAARTNYPYLVLGYRSRLNEGGAMQVTGDRVTLQLDCWSKHKGPSQAAAILSRVVTLRERQPLIVSGYELLEGSVTCELEDVFDEEDPDAPDQRLYHGFQRWVAEIHGR
jgi:hypothetical protein